MLFSCRSIAYKIYLKIIYLQLKIYLVIFIKIIDRIAPSKSCDIRYNLKDNILYSKFSLIIV